MYRRKAQQDAASYEWSKHMRCKGIITFDSRKGWYFAENLNDHLSVFCHIRDVVDQRVLKVDDIITFDLTESSKFPGKLQAANIRWAGHNVARQVSAEGRQ